MGWGNQNRRVEGFLNHVQILQNYIDNLLNLQTSKVRVILGQKYRSAKGITPQGVAY